jgi:hypothetical protein
MTFSNSLRMNDSLRTVAAFLLMFMIVGLTSCLVCNQELCCKQPGHDDEAGCACGCIIQNMLGTSPPQIAIYNDYCFHVESISPRLQPSSPQPLYRPPRA